MIQLAIENISLELIREAGVDCTMFFDALARPVIIANGGEENTRLLLEKQLSAARDKLRFYFQFDFAAGVGWCVASLMELPHSFRSASLALGYRNGFSENNIVNIVNVPVTGLPKAQSVRTERDMVIEIYRNCDYDGMESVLQRYFSSVVTAAGGSEAFAKQMYIELMVLLINCAEESGLDIDLILSTDPYAKIVLSTNLNMIHRQFTDTCGLLMEQMVNKRKDRTSRLIEQARRYIRENISNTELNLTMVGESIGLSGSYLCSLFRRETGYNFTEYVNRERVEQAKSLLSSTNMRVYEVALSVGYLSPKYFFQVFKRITGKRPREFSNNA